MEKEIKLVLADDHPILLKGLSEMLIDLKYDVLAMSKNGVDAFEKIKTLKPDVAILDIDMPELTGIEVAERCQQEGLGTRVVLLSYSKEPALILRAKELNILGYLIKEDALQDIDRCIRAVMRGEYFFSNKLNQVDTTQTSRLISILESLSPTEQKVLLHISKGLSTKNTASALSISPRTVDKHRSHIINKLGLMGQPNKLLQWAIKNKDSIQQVIKD